jgi:hypothetical protein
LKQERIIIEPPGNRGIASKVSDIFEGPVAPFSLTTYSDHALKGGMKRMSKKADEYRRPG